MAVFRTRHTGSLRVPGQRQTSQGESDPKPRSLRVRGRRRWRAGRRFLHPCVQPAKGGRDRKHPPPEWTGAVVVGGDEIQANPDLTYKFARMTGGAVEVPERGVVSRSPRKASSRPPGNWRRRRTVRTAHRHRWAGVSTPRWTSDPPLRNSAN